MQPCEWEARLKDWVLEELAPEEANEVERHVKQCPECARSAQPLRELRQALMSSLTDQQMPAHLVLAGESGRNSFAGFWASLARTAALSAAAACIFLAILSVGFAHWRLLPLAAQQKPALTRGAVQALVAQAVADQAAARIKETEASNQELAASLRQEQVNDLAQLARRLQYLELAQNTVWKEAQQQNEVVSMIARDYLQPVPANSSRR